MVLMDTMSLGSGVLVCFRDTQYLIHRGDASERFIPSVRPERFHSIAYRRLLDHVRRAGLGDQMANLFIGDEQFINPHSPAVSCASTALAADGSVEDQFRIGSGFQRKIVRHFFLGGVIRLFAFLAQDTDQTLGHNSFDGARHQKRLDPHVP